MNVTNKIDIHLDDLRLIPPIDAMQGDANTRVLEFSLYSGGEAWNVPDGVEVLVGYGGASGRGLYSTLLDEETPAYTVSGNVVTVTLIPQVTAVAGRTAVTVMFMDDASNQIATFTVIIRVAPNPALGAGRPEDYFGIRQWVGAGPLVVTATVTGTAASVAKSFSEIKDAYDAGREVVCRWGAGVMPLQAISTKMAVFQTITGSSYSQIKVTKGETDDLPDTVEHITGRYAPSSALDEYAKATDLRTPLEVVSDDGKSVDTPFDEIWAAHTAQRPVYCKWGTFVLPLMGADEEDGLVFQSVANQVFVRLTVKPSGEVVSRINTYALATDLAGKMDVPGATDEKYFNITTDGIISLKPEYRGAGAAGKDGNLSDTTESDNGLGVAGSHNLELPEEIIIPATIGGTTVTGYADGMFFGNRRLRRLTLLSSVTTIPKSFCNSCFNLREVVGTEAVTTICKGAFGQSGIIHANFPKLTSLPDGNQFNRCANLLTANIGTVEAIPSKCFMNCDKLTQLSGASVTSIGDYALYATRNLETPDFLANVVKIGACGLFLSRVDYTGSATVGTNGVTINLQATRYWEGISPMANNIKVGSTFEQDNPLWADRMIGNSDRTYSQSGCAACACATIYSILEDKPVVSPVAFMNAAYAGNSELKDLPIYESIDNVKKHLEAVGYTVTDPVRFTAETLPVMYAALEPKEEDEPVQLVIARIVGDYEMTPHAVVFRGINDKGEVMVVDSDSAASELGIYEAATYSMPIQNLCLSAENFTNSDSYDYFMIVTK